MNPVPCSSSSLKSSGGGEELRIKMENLEKRVKLLGVEENSAVSNSSLQMSDRLLNLEQRLEKLEGSGSVGTNLKKTNALYLIPEEVWDLVFNHLRGKDLENCYNTCKLWQTSLQKSRAEFLFQKVLPVLIGHQYLTSKDLISSCRGVSRSWHQAVDNYLINASPGSKVNNFEDRHFDEVDDMARYYRLRYERNSSVHIFDRRSTLGRFTQAVESFHAGDFNPFIKKQCVAIRDKRSGSSSPNSVARRSRMWSFAEKKFFPKFAPHITSLVLDGIELSSEMAFYTKVLSCLKLLPHLKGLELVFVNNHLTENFTNRLRELEWKIQNAKYHLPDLPQLSILKVKYIPTVVVIQFLKKCKLIKKLQLGETGEDYFRLYSECRDNQIKELSLHLESEKDLRPLELTSWPLETLNLSLHCGILRDFDTLLNTINSFAATLKCLRIQFNCRYSQDLSEIVMSKYLRLRLPHLLSLTIIGDLSDFCPCSIDFILPLTSLEELRVVRRDQLLRNHPRWDPRNIIQFYELFDKMYQSNIWEVIPTLRDIDVKWCHNQDGDFSRRIYSKDSLPEVLIID